MGAGTSTTAGMTTAVFGADPLVFPAVNSDSYTHKHRSVLAINHTVTGMHALRVCCPNE